MKFVHLIECNIRNIFPEKIMHKMKRGNYSEALFEKNKIEQIPGSIVYSFI